MIRWRIGRRHGESEDLDVEVHQRSNILVEDLVSELHARQCGVSTKLDVNPSVRPGVTETHERSTKGHDATLFP